MIAQTIIGMNRLMQDMFMKEYHRKHVVLIPEIAESLKAWAGIDRIYVVQQVTFTSRVFQSKFVTLKTLLEFFGYN